MDMLPTVAKLIGVTLICVVLLIQPGTGIRCSICDTAENGEACRTHPPPPVDCPGLDYCMTLARFTLRGHLKTFSRICSPMALPPACVRGVDRVAGDGIKLCYTTCARSGCNGSRSLHHLLELLRR